MADTSQVLLIDSEEATAGYLRETLIMNGGYSVSFENNTRKGANVFRQSNFDVVIVRFSNSNLSEEINLVKDLKKIDPSCIIIAFVDEQNSRVLKDLSELDIYDYISRPISLEKINFLIKKGKESRSLIISNQKTIQALQEQNNSLQKQNTLLARRIEESTKNLSRLYDDLRTTYMRTVKSLAFAIDARDHYTHSHSQNVAKYSVVIAEEMLLSIQDIEMIREASELHDLGKIGIIDSILLKPSSLAPEEWKEIKRHPEIGAQILEPLPFLDNVITMIRQHHEHYDGSGYPDSLHSEEILLGARIIHIADAYESMTSARAYRKIPLPKEEALLEIKKNSGTQFDPKVVEAFFRVVDRM